ncbi:MAG: hydantoinase B/oxoprolinase family protein, partial [Burkholderiaceae bacterium]|nr:hydantoinase B/oxoprolinase family protein [Burkholderiaceae bacterium]
TTDSITPRRSRPRTTLSLRAATCRRRVASTTALAGPSRYSAAGVRRSSFTVRSISSVCNSLGRNWVERADGTVEHFGATHTVEMWAGDVFAIETPGGGGFGA